MKFMKKMMVTSIVTSFLGLATGSAMAADSLQDIMKARGLTEKDILAAAKTYTPTGGRDDRPGDGGCPL